MVKKLLCLIFLVCFSCSKQSISNENFLETIKNQVWTRGSNYKVFKNNPFSLILIEDGTCLEFNEAPKIINDNEFQYTLLENQKDTLRLGYKVFGTNVNHCGTFTYFLKSNGDLFRNYVECGEPFYKESLTTIFYISDQTLSNLCPDL